MDTEVIKWVTAQFIQAGTVIAVVGVFGKMTYKWAKETFQLGELQKDLNAAFGKIREVERENQNLKEELEHLKELVMEMMADEANRPHS